MIEWVSNDGFRGCNVLIVGGAGFVGSNLTKHILAQQPRRLTVVDNLLSADRANVPDHPALSFILGTITDDAILAKIDADIDYAFHLACYHGNQSSIHDPIADHANNTLTSLKLFERLKGIDTLRKVVYSAAGCAVAEKVYGTPRATSEDAPISLFHDSPYSISKLIGEMYGNYYFTRYNMPFVRARFQNVYGPGEILGAGEWRGTEHTVWRNVTPTFIWKALHGQPLPVENDGMASRDFIYVDDIVRGLAACALRGRAGEAYNLATGVEVTIRELAETVNEITGNTMPIDLKPARSWDRSGRRYGDPSKARDNLGFTATVPHREGLLRTVEWTRTNKNMIRRCMLQHAEFVPEVRSYF
jgi:nucleoside-diphosphate-sugar epimerase